MRWVPLALLLAACTAPTGPTPIDGTEFCRRFTTVIGALPASCCAGAGASPDLADFAEVCRNVYAPVLDDPRVGVDTPAAETFLAEAERRLRACDPLWSVWVFGEDGFRTIFAGTRGLGTSCSPLDSTDTAGLFSCADGYCPVTGDPTARTCQPFVVEGGACTTELDCAFGLHCTTDGSTVGVCQSPQGLGAHCHTSSECSSGFCAGGLCTTPDPTRPGGICVTPPVVTDRDVDLTLTAFDPSPTREVTLRVLDATDQATVVYRVLGLPDATSTHRIPRSVPIGQAYTAQIWTTDPASPTPETRSWEVPIAADGAIAIAVTFTDVTTPITRMPPPSLDTLLDLQFFDFDPELGKRFDVRLREASSRRVVAQVRMAAIPDIMFTIDVPDCVRAGVQYELQLAVDANGSGAYEPPPADHAWSALASAQPTGGLSLPFAWSSTYRDVQF